MLKGPDVAVGGSPPLLVALVLGSVPPPVLSVQALASLAVPALVARAARG